jgi:hypothetical protein
MRPSLARGIVASSVLVAAVALAGCSGGVAGVENGTSSSGGSGTSGTSGGIAPDAPPSPSFLGASRGCGDVFVARANADGTQYVTVQIDRDALGMQPGTSRTMDLASAPSTVKVRVEVYASAPGEAKYCNDVGTAPIASTTWSAEAGTLEVQLGTRKAEGDTYRATIRLENLRLVGPERGTSAIVPKIEIKDVLVGWLAG